jgi:photosystem II stability/assembly factor-like uncharacterized protein
MRKVFAQSCIAAIAILTFFGSAFLGSTRMGTTIGERESFDAVDNDWFMLQRVYPHDDIDPSLYENARAQVHRMAQDHPEGLIARWSLVGPSNIGGRITSIALDPTNASIIYAGAASGALWKSTDNGGTWSNIFTQSFTIGSVILDPTNPQIVYVGTGEANPGGVAIYPGNGIWRSTNGGNSWTNLGLTNSGQIGRLAIHPSSPNRIFAAALGRYRSRTQERGIYRTTNAGTSWQRVLFVDDTTGACDVIINPANPNRILAAMWTRYRPITYSVINSSVSGLFLSANGGDTWTQVTNGFPNNDPTVGRISLGVSPSQPNIVFAIVSNGTGVMGIYRSGDAGDSWTRVSTSTFGNEGQSWYNTFIAVSPIDTNYVLSGFTNFYRSSNGGTSWTSSGTGMHVDHHAIAFDVNTPTKVVVGNDGGVFISTTSGTSWTKSLNLPISQFYAGTVDYQLPQRVLGGLQDNGTPRTTTGSVNDWSSIYGGDGFYCLVDPTNSNRVYAESQNGGLGYSTNGGTSFSTGTSGISSSDRKNWCTPIALDWNNTLTLYTGTQNLYKTTTGMQSWTAISADLTRGVNGRIGTITTIDVAKSNSNVIYVGTDDGKVSVTTDGGTTWTDVTGSLPIHWVTRVTADPDSANVVYVTLSGYLEDLTGAHIYRSRNYGQTWTNIGSNLPNFPLNDVIVDPVYRPNLYVASDAGVMYSTNMGGSWSVLSTGLPEVPVHDLTLHSPTRKLYAFTHGRSSFSVDLTGLVSVQLASNEIPNRYALDQNFPNPFNPTTAIKFSVPKSSHVSLKVYDVRGKEVAQLVNNSLEAGEHQIQFDARRLSSGTYFYRLESGSFSETRKMLFIK